jgi:Spy/CpxP family protein refolding chaperone
MTMAWNSLAIGSINSGLEEDMRINRQKLVALFIIAITLSAFSVSYGQDPPPPPAPPADMIEQLQLTPDQRQNIRAIREETKNERTVINQRLREANFALEQALDVDNPNEALIEQRLRDATAAQAASMRMRILTEVKIRRVLTQEQLSTLRTLRLQARGVMRDQRIQNQRRNRRDNVLGPGRNGIAPIFRRRNALPRNPRP